MLSIGEDAAAEVMKHLTQLEINQLSLAMARVSNVSKGEVTEVFQQFIDAMLDESSIGIGSSSYVQGSSSGRSAPTRPSASSLALVRATILPASKQSRCRIPAFSRR
jgi:flagellar motor switch protein FliG